MNAANSNKRPFTLADLPPIPVSKEQPHFNEHQNPLSIKKIDRRAIEKRRLELEKESRKYWRKVRYIAVVIVALLFIAASLKHQFVEIADFVTSIDPSIENVTRWFREIIFLISGY